MTSETLDSPATITIWHATSSSAEPGPIEQHCHEWLVDSERQRAGRFRVPTSRNQNIVGRGMSRRLLCADGFEPQQIEFDLEPHGKPFVAGPDSLRRPFNVAHTDGLVLCGVGPTSVELVGVDVERLGRRTDPDLATRYFSRPEVDYLQQFKLEHDRRDAFLRIWTLKESFIKAIGTGLQTPLADFAFEEIDSDSPRIRFLSSALESDVSWKFFCFHPRPGFVASTAIGHRGEVADSRVELRSFDEWLDQNTRDS